MRYSMSILFAAVLISCSGDTNPPVVVGNTNPLGSVGGLVLDGVSEMPLSGATVKLVSGGKTLMTTSGADGTFTVAKVPAGSFIVNVSNMGYEMAIFTGTLSGSVGNFPVTDPVMTIGPLALIKNDGTFAVKIVDQLGAPVPNVPVVARPGVRWLDYSNGSPLPRGNYEVTGMSGNDGTVMLTGLPEYASLGMLGPNFDSLPIDVPPVMVMSTPAYQFLGGTFPFPVAHLANSSSSVIDAQVIRLAGPQTDLSVLDSNVDYLRGQSASSSHGFSAGVAGFIGANGPVTVVFNEAINRSTVRAQLFNEDASQASVSMMATGSSNLLTITPMSALTAGKRYNLALHVDAAAVPGISNTRELNITVPLFTQPAPNSVISIDQNSAKTSADKTTVTFSFSQPIGIGFGSTGSVSCVAYYDNINLTNGMGNYGGEWNNGMGMICPNPSVDITAMSPLEPSTSGIPVTGFSSKWQIVFDTLQANNSTSCKPPLLRPSPGCSPPAPQTTIHFVFGKASAGNTIKLPDGTVVPDSAMRTLIIPSP
jgi:hypothetical protein